MRLRAVLAFLILPGVVAGLLPALLLCAEKQNRTGSSFGIVLLGVGAFLLLWCVRDFLVIGKGTLAPWDPPQRLVSVRLYRFVRNPMYIAVLILLAGWAIAAGSQLLAAYVALMAFIFHLRVLFYEERRLAIRFGAEWKAYSASVPRWLPRCRNHIRSGKGGGFDLGA